MSAIKIAATVLFLIGLVLAGTFASRHVPVEVEEGETATNSEKIEAWSDKAGLGFGLGAALMIGGALLARFGNRKKASDGEVNEERETVPSLFATIRERLVEEPKEDPKERRVQLKTNLDEVLEELVPKVLDQRESMIAEMGLGDFAEMIGHFAAMERNAARAWSALTDECDGEIPACLERAVAGLDRAIEAMEAPS